MLSIAVILQVVAQVYRIPVSTMISKTRRAPVVEARQAAMLVLRNMRPDLSLLAIVRAVGRTDHSTAIWGIEAAEDRCSTCPEAAARMERIMTRLDNLRAPAPIRAPWGAGLWWHNQTAPIGPALAA